MPPVPAPFNRDERSVQLLDLLRQRLDNGSIVVTYSIWTASQVNQEYFFIAPYPLRVISVAYTHVVPDVGATIGVSVVRMFASELIAPGDGMLFTQLLMVYLRR